MDEACWVSGCSAVGLDLGDRFNQYCILDHDGAVVEEGRVRTTREALEARFQAFRATRIGMEVGTHSPWVSRLLEDLGHEVYVANPTRLRLIHKSPRKNDRADAEALARLTRADPKLLAPVRHRGREAQVDLALLRARATLVAARTQLVNHARGPVKAIGARLPSCSTPAFPGKVADSIPEELQAALQSVMTMITCLTIEIRNHDREIEKLASTRYPETTLLRQVSGVGPITALTYVLTIDDPSRFRKSREVGAYLGLTRRQHQSGDQDPERRITKAGDQALRRLLVQAAHWILGPFGPDTDLRRWGLTIAQRGRKNAKKRAVVAVARKLAVLLHRLWVDGGVYEPLRNGCQYQARRA